MAKLLYTTGNAAGRPTGKTGAKKRKDIYWVVKQRWQGAPQVEEIVWYRVVETWKSWLTGEILTNETMKEGSDEEVGGKLS